MVKGQPVCIELTQYPQWPILPQTGGDSQAYWRVISRTWTSDITTPPHYPLPPFQTLVIACLLTRYCYLTIVNWYGEDGIVLLWLRTLQLLRDFPHCVEGHYCYCWCDYWLGFGLWLVFTADLVPELIVHCAVMVVLTWLWLLMCQHCYSQPLDLFLCVPVDWRCHDQLPASPGQFTVLILWDVNLVWTTGQALQFILGLRTPNPSGWAFTWPDIIGQTDAQLPQQYYWPLVRWRWLTEPNTGVGSVVDWPDVLLLVLLTKPRCDWHCYWRTLLLVLLNVWLTSSLLLLYVLTTPVVIGSFLLCPSPNLPQIELFPDLLEPSHAQRNGWTWRTLIYSRPPPRTLLNWRLYCEPRTSPITGGHADLTDFGWLLLLVCRRTLFPDCLLCPHAYPGCYSLLWLPSLTGDLMIEPLLVFLLAVYC